MGLFYEVRNDNHSVRISDTQSAVTVDGVIIPVGGSGGSLTFGTATAHPVIFTQNNVEKLRLTSTNIQANTGIRLLAGSATAPSISTPTNYGMYEDDGLVFSTANTMRFRIGSGGLSNFFGQVNSNSLIQGNTLRAIATGTPTAPSIYGIGGDTTGIYWTGSSPSTTFFTTGGTLLATFGSNVEINKGQLLAQAGTVFLPSISFISDPDTGFKSQVAGRIELVSDAQNIGYFSIASGRSIFVGSQETRLGSSATYINCDNNSNGVLGFWTGNQQVARVTRAITTNGQFQVLTGGNATNPVISNSGGATGLFFPAGNIVALSTGGTEGLRLDDSQRLGLGVTSPTSKLHIDGSTAFKVSDISSDITLGEHFTALISASGAARTITLPAVTGCTGRVYVVKKVDSSVNTVTIVPSDTATLDGASSIVLSNQYDYVTLCSSGSNWFVIAQGV